MDSTATDYLWFEEDFPDLADAYCFTLVHKLMPADIIQRLSGDDEPALTGASALVEAAHELYCRPDGARQLIAMTTLGAWTLMIEPSGYLGVTEDRALPASAGTTWISHFTNVNALDLFLWAQDGVVRLTFEPMFPDTRWGSTPDELLDLMHRVGFRFRDDPNPDLSPLAAFALADHLSGIMITPELLQETTFTCGSTKVT